MKKILIIITFFISCIITANTTIAGGSNTSNTSTLDKNLENNITTLLDQYTPEKVVKPGDATVETGLKTIINNVVTNLSYILGILAIGAIVYGGIILTTSAGEDEKITKGKNIIKWSLIGFVGLVSAAGLIKIVISVMYGLSNV